MRRMASSVWTQGFVAADGVKGLRIRTPLQEKDKVEVMLEEWEAGTAEPPHSHSGDDMTTVIEGRMTVQRFVRGAGGELVKDGPLAELRAGQTGYIPANVIHDASYLEHCRLVYVHSGAFSFTDESAKKN
jgi:quercetin dioxygenase-like cupin family protein